MKKLEVLNNYAGCGGNRKHWENVEVTAVEWDQKTADVYQELFPDDTVIVADAHQYLIDHYKEFDFIWSSPPCPTHSNVNNFLNAQGVIRYPDMALYQEIIFLKHFFKEGKYCVENVVSYYDPLIKPQLLHRHYFWANFLITPLRVNAKGISVTNSRGSTRRTTAEHLKSLQEHHGFPTVTDIKMLSNCVYPPLGQHIMKCAMGKTQQTL